MRQLLLLVTVLVLLSGAARAQDNNTCIPFMPEDVLKALTFAEDVFEREMWNQSFRGDTSRVSVEWQRQASGAVGYLDYLIFSCGYSDEEFEAYFGDDYWDITLSTYETWQRGEQCEQDDITLHEFKLTSDGQPYRMRYWIQTLSDTRILTFQIAFPSSEADLLNTYAERLFPDFPSCDTLATP